MVLKQTPLHSAHLAAGAKMVDFGGWDMPVNYGSQLEEHRAVRNSAGMFDVSHMLAIDIEGAGARDFLRYALANNVDKLRIAGKALYSCLLNPDGGVRDDLIVYLRADEAYRVVVNASTADKDLAWLEQLARRESRELVLAPRRDLAMIAVQGPQARQRLWQAAPATRASSEGLAPFASATIATPFGECLVARTGYTGEDGFEVMLGASHAPLLWNAIRAAGVEACGLGARDTLRLEAGMNLYGQDMDERVTPLESGLAWTVDLAGERDFVGRGALVAQKASRTLVGLVLIEPGGVLRAHQRVDTQAGEGEITSGTFSPTLGVPIALARVPSSVGPEDRVRVAIRDKSLAARVVKPPFVRHGKSLVS